MRLPPLLALLALGCSEAPPATDAGTDAPSALDAGTDAGQAPDVPLVVDAPTSRDAGVDAPDVVAAPDAAREDAVDAQLPDVVDAAVAVPDAPVVDAVEAVEDAARDAGMVDAGPQVYALDPPPSVTEVRVLFFETCDSQDGGPCGAIPITMVRSGSCSRTGSRLNFTLDTGYQITGLFPDYRSTAGASIAVVGGAATQGRDFVIEAGTVAGGRQSFRVSFSAPATRSVGGVSGVPGRTLDPSRGDVWLLGCEVR